MNYTRVLVPATLVQLCDRVSNNCGKSFGQAEQQMVIDKAINHLLQRRKLYRPLRVSCVVLINVATEYY